MCPIFTQCMSFSSLSMVIDGYAVLEIRHCIVDLAVLTQAHFLDSFFKCSYDLTAKNQIFFTGCLYLARFHIGCNSCAKKCYWCAIRVACSSFYFFNIFLRSCISLLSCTSSEKVFWRSFCAWCTFNQEICEKILREACVEDEHSGLDEIQAWQVSPWSKSMLHKGSENSIAGSAPCCSAFHMVLTLYIGFFFKVLNMAAMHLWIERKPKVDSQERVRIIEETYFANSRYEILEQRGTTLTWTRIFQETRWLLFLPLKIVTIVCKGNPRQTWMMWKELCLIYLFYSPLAPSWEHGLLFSVGLKKSILVDFLHRLLPISYNFFFFWCGQHVIFLDFNFSFQMMWAADFDEAGALALNENGLEPLTLQLSTNPDGARTEAREGGRKNLTGSLSEHDSDGNSPPHDNGERSVPRNSFCGLARASFWARHDHMHVCTASTPGTKIGCDELPVFCVAAILIINRLKITRETQSSDDMIKVGVFFFWLKKLRHISSFFFFYHGSMISGWDLLGWRVQFTDFSLVVKGQALTQNLLSLQIFNDKLLKINVKRCVRLAIKLRKRYFYKVRCSFS